MRHHIYPINQILITATLLLCCSAGYASAPTVQVGGDFRQMSVATCTLKAVEAMAIKQNFIHAEINGPEAWGYNENSFVMVHAIPINDGVQIFVVAFSTDNTEAERLRNEIREHVFNGPYNQRISQGYTTSDANRRQTPLRIHWGNFNKGVSQKTFRLCAQSAMSHNGLRASVGSDRVVYGTSNTVTVVAIGLQLPSTTQVLVITASMDSNEAERLRNEVRSQIVGCTPFDESQ